jgi:hypothetical protein
MQGKDRAESPQISAFIMQETTPNFYKEMPISHSVQAG